MCSGLHYFVQILSISDCVYRAMYRTRYLISQDLDELIVPMKVDSWADMILDVTAKTKRHAVASYNIKNVHFPTKAANDERFSNSSAAVKYNIIPLLKTRSTNVIYPDNIRSKVGYHSSPEQMGFH